MHDDGFFDARVAAIYDDPENPYAPAEEVDFLASFASEGPVLELGIGTGRVAIPLVAKGIEVHGIELSQAMVDKLREKPGGASIPVTIGDFSVERAPGEFRLAYLVFNTIMNLTSQGAQVACFQNVAVHLKPGACFVIDVMLPDLQRLPFGHTIRPYEMGESKWDFDEYDIAHQGLISHHFNVVNGSLEQDSIPFRYVWPSELDLMAQMAGMSLKERWGGWNREPFTNLSERHISVWES